MLTNTKNQQQQKKKMKNVSVLFFGYDLINSIFCCSCCCDSWVICAKYSRNPDKARNKMLLDFAVFFLRISLAELLYEKIPIFLVVYAYYDNSCSNSMQGFVCHKLYIYNFLQGGNFVFKLICCFFFWMKNKNVK